LETSCRHPRGARRGTTSPVTVPIVASPFQAAAPTSSTILWLLLAALYIAFFLVALWVYQDSRIRGMRGPLWFIISFAVPIGGFAAYMILRRERSS
jgi:hypothetical protein